MATGVNPRRLSNRDPIWKFVLGTNYESRVLYTDGDEGILSRMMENDGISNGGLDDRPEQGHLDLYYVLVIEVQERYGYMVQIAVFIMAGGGVVILERLLEDCRRIIDHMVSKGEKIS